MRKFPKLATVLKVIECPDLVSFVIRFFANSTSFGDKITNYGHSGLRVLSRRISPVSIGENSIEITCMSFLLKTFWMVIFRLYQISRRDKGLPFPALNTHDATTKLLIGKIKTVTSFLLPGLVEFVQQKSGHTEL